MTTTLSSAGGISLVTDGTGPTLQIKGLTGGTGTVITSNANDISFRTKTLGETMRFIDDFINYNDFVNYPNSNYLNIANALVKLKIWEVVSENGAGTTMSTATPWPGGGGLGILQFSNIGSTGFGTWNMTATSSAFNIINDSVPISCESAVFIETPPTNEFSMEFGLWKNDGSTGSPRLSFFIYPGLGYVHAKTTITIPTTTAIPYNSWNIYRIVRRSDNFVEFFINNVSVCVTPFTSTGLYYPFMRFFRTGNATSANYYCDYIEVIRDANRR